jgi:hypothetical protein
MRVQSVNFVTHFYFLFFLQSKKTDVPVLEYAYEVRTSYPKATQYLTDASPLQLLLLDVKGNLLGTAAGKSLLYLYPT